MILLCNTATQNDAPPPCFMSIFGTNEDCYVRFKSYFFGSGTKLSSQGALRQTPSRSDEHWFLKADYYSQSHGCCNCSDCAFLEHIMRFRKSMDGNEAWFCWHQCRNSHLQFFSFTHLWLFLIGMNCLNPVYHHSCSLIKGGEYFLIYIKDCKEYMYCNTVWSSCWAMHVYHLPSNAVLYSLPPYL